MSMVRKTVFAAAREESRYMINGVLFDCRDECLDADGDGYGSAGGAGNTCTAADCDDAVSTCSTDCTTTCSFQ